MIIEELQTENILNAHSHKRFYRSVDICRELGKVLNKVHGVNYSERFWQILIFPYAGLTVSQMHLFNDPGFDAVPDFEEVNGFARAGVKEKIKIRLIGLIKKSVSLNNFSVTRNLLAHENQLTIGFENLSFVKEELGRPLPQVLFYPVTKGDAAVRRKVNEIAGGYEDVFWRNAVRLIPKVYVEFFSKILSAIPLISPQQKIFHVQILGGIYNRMMIAAYTEKGAKLFWYQHGAFYGEVVGAQHLERSLADEFRTWGWKIKQEDIPWKAYRLEKFSRKYDAAPKDKKFDFLICFPQISKTDDPYMPKAAYFLKHIDSNRYHRFLARPRALNKIFSHAKELYFMKHNKRVAIDSGLSSMPEIIASSRLVIQFSVPATNFLECIYTDHPTMGLLENREPTDLVKPYYNFFLEKGVLHSTFEGLVAHLNKINIDEWWQTVINEPQYKSFKKTFANKV